MDIEPPTSIGVIHYERVDKMVPPVADRISLLRAPWVGIAIGLPTPSNRRCRYC